MCLLPDLKMGIVLRFIFRFLLLLLFFLLAKHQTTTPVGGEGGVLGVGCGLEERVVWGAGKECYMCLLPDFASVDLFFAV